MQFSLASVLIALTASVSAAPSLNRRAEATCGTQYYSAAQVKEAIDAACGHFEAGTTVGSNDYPHRYNNYEGFEFKGLEGPFLEFPIVSGGEYTGGSPGADRVVITEDCVEAGAITHTGADGNDFVACEGTSKGGDDDRKSRPGRGGSGGNDDDDEDSAAPVTGRSLSLAAGALAIALL